MKVAIALSGGVDSSVAADLLLKEGHELVAVTMNCCDAHQAAAEAAAEVASALKIPHYVLDLHDLFDEKVIEPFTQSYLSGETPSPCVYCNRAVKFGYLIEKIKEFGATHLVTGHYAQLRTEHGFPVLERGVDPKKDQSYFLFNVTDEALNHTIFPLGGWCKTDVRRYALENKLPVATKPDSEDICFVPNNDYVSLLENRRPELRDASGLIVDTTGKKLGMHCGQHRFTIGQRKGLGVASSGRLYVVEKRGTTVILGNSEALDCPEIQVRDCRWFTDPQTQKTPSMPFEAIVKIRSTDGGAEAIVTPEPEHRAKVHFSVPARGVAKGQAAVFYIENRVIGGGFIA